MPEISTQNMEQCIKKAVADAIQVNVNGKIDALSKEIKVHNELHENDMKRILPVVEAFETSKSSGKMVLWVAGSVTAVGSAYIVLRNIFH